MQLHWKLWMIAALLVAGPPGAVADDNDAAKLTSECGARSLPPTSVDSCLERVRILEETDPSADLHSLEASLERRAAGEHPAAVATASTEPERRSAPQTSGATPDQSGPSDDPAVMPGFHHLTGPDAEDQPPIADSDDTPPASDGVAPEDPGNPE